MRWLSFVWLLRRLVGLGFVWGLFCGSLCLIVLIVVCCVCLGSVVGMVLLVVSLWWVVWDVIAYVCIWYLVCG